MNWYSLFSPQALNEGKNFKAKGQLYSLGFHPAQIQYKVGRRNNQGIVTVPIELNSKTIIVRGISCDCPEGSKGYCSHMAAALFTLEKLGTVQIPEDLFSKEVSKDKAVPGVSPESSEELAKKEADAAPVSSKIKATPSKKKETSPRKNDTPSRDSSSTAKIPAPDLQPQKKEVSTPTAPQEVTLEKEAAAKPVQPAPPQAQTSPEPAVQKEKPSAVQAEAAPPIPQEKPISSQTAKEAPIPSRGSQEAPALSQVPKEAPAPSQVPKEAPAPTLHRTGQDRVPHTGELTELSKIQNEKREEAKQKEVEVRGYRYFQTGQFLKSVLAYQTIQPSSKRLISQKAFTPIDVQIEYEKVRSWEGESLVATGKTKCTIQGLKGKPEVFDVSVSVDSQKVCNASCACTACLKAKYNRVTMGPIRLCQHTLAALFLLTDYLRVNKPGDHTNRTGLALIDAYKNEISSESLPAYVEWRTLGNEIRKKASHSDKEEEKLRLMPSLKLFPKLILQAGKTPYLTFCFGRNKEEEIPNLPSFVISMENKGHFNGKLEKLRLNASSLDAPSKLFYDILVGELDDLAVKRLSKDGMEGIRALAGLPNPLQKYPLSPDTMDDLCQVAIDHDLSLRVCQLAPDGKRVLKESRLNIKYAPLSQLIELKLSACMDDRRETFEGIKITGRAPLYLEGGIYGYLLEKHLYRYYKESLKPILPLLTTSQNGNIECVIGMNNLQSFYTKIFPTLRKSIPIVENDASIIRQYLPSEPFFIIYLDSVDNNFVAKADVLYGKKVYSITDLLLEEKGEQISFEGRRKSKELEVLKLLKRYFPDCDLNTQVFYIHRQELGAIAILTEGIYRLQDVAEVQVTSRFKAIGKRSQIPITITASLGTLSLMELKVSSSLYSPEELVDIVSSYKRKKTFVRLKNGDIIKLSQDETLDELIETLNDLGVDIKSFVKGKLHLPAYRALYLDKLMEGKQHLYINRDESLMEQIRKYESFSSEIVPIPESLENILRPYQKDGYQWLYTLDKNGFGGILADEMGLGKTLQVISVVLAYVLNQKKEGKRILPSLVICPASLVYNWGDELAKFTPELVVSIIDGNKDMRSSQLGSYMGGKAQESPHILITSYDLIKRDFTDYERMKFRFLVVDEAQYIKNHRTLISRVVKMVSAQTRYALTGTPIENRLSELWNIFDFLMPGFLFTFEKFHREYEVPSMREDAQGEAVKERIRRMITPFVLRRQKSDVLKDLPPKIEETKLVRLSPEQQNLYDGMVLRIKEDIRGKSEVDFKRSRIFFLSELMHLREVCCDPSLVYDGYGDSSAKRDMCIELVKNLMEEGHKALIFSQFTRMLDLLKQSFDAEEIPSYMLTGSTPKAERFRLISAFNEDDTPVFLISLKAGGTGVNLTGADVVIHYDPWWNVAAENQATDRAHRIGQTKPVTVYKLIAKGTVEENVIKLQQEKASLANYILSGEGISSSIVTKEDLLNLL